MTPQYTGALVVIPTRNRATLARNAICSVLAQADDEVQVLVSDNSTSEEEIASLADFCVELKDARLRYVRPPRPLPMGKHWEWAMQQALECYDASHILYLTDRMIYKAGALKEVLEIARLYPDKVITFNTDGIRDNEQPVVLVQVTWTGKLFEIKSTDLLRLSSQLVVHHSIPRMLNGVAPRSVLNAMQERFSTRFDAINPDFCFGYRCLEMVDSILYWDKAVTLHYGLARSNGMSQGIGVPNQDHADFLANLDERGLHYAAPVPAFKTVGNAMIHEYCLVKEQTKSPKFPEVNRRRYLASIEQEINGLQNPQLQQEMRRLLAAQPRERRTPEKLADVLGKLLSPRRVWVKMRWLASMPRLQPLWNVAQRCGIYPPALRDIGMEFDSVAAAMEHANTFPSRRNTGLSHLETLMAVRRLPHSRQKDWLMSNPCAGVD